MDARSKPTQHGAIDPMKSTRNGAELAQQSLQLSGRASTKPSPTSVKGSLVDGPYGGKKPQS